MEDEQNKNESKTMVLLKKNSSSENKKMFSLNMHSNNSDTFLMRYMVTETSDILVAQSITTQKLEYCFPYGNQVVLTRSMHQGSFNCRSFVISSDAKISYYSDAIFHQHVTHSLLFNEFLRNFSSNCLSVSDMSRKTLQMSNYQKTFNLLTSFSNLSLNFAQSYETCKKQWSKEICSFSNDFDNMKYPCNSVRRIIFFNTHNKSVFYNVIKGDAINLKDKFLNFTDDIIKNYPTSNEIQKLNEINKEENDVSNSYRVLSENSNSFDNITNLCKEPCNILIVCRRLKDVSDLSFEVLSGRKFHFCSEFKVVISMSNRESYIGVVMEDSCHVDNLSVLSYRNIENSNFRGSKLHVKENDIIHFNLYEYLKTEDRNKKICTSQKNNDVKCCLIRTKNGKPFTDNTDINNQPTNIHMKQYLGCFLQQSNGKVTSIAVKHNESEEVNILFYINFTSTILSEYRTYRFKNLRYCLLTAKIKSEYELTFENNHHDMLLENLERDQVTNCVTEKCEWETKLYDMQHKNYVLKKDLKENNTHKVSEDELNCQANSKLLYIKQESNIVIEDERRNTVSSHMKGLSDQLKKRKCKEYFIEKSKRKPTLIYKYGDCECLNANDFIAKNKKVIKPKKTYHKYSIMREILREDSIDKIAKSEINCKVNIETNVRKQSRNITWAESDYERNLSTDIFSSISRKRKHIETANSEYSISRKVSRENSGNEINSELRETENCKLHIRTNILNERPNVTRVEIDCEKRISTTAIFNNAHRKRKYFDENFVEESKRKVTAVIKSEAGKCSNNSKNTISFPMRINQTLFDSFNTSLTENYDIQEKNKAKFQSVAFVESVEEDLYFSNEEEINESIINSNEICSGSTNFISRINQPIFDTSDTNSIKINDICWKGKDKLQSLGILVKSLEENLHLCSSEEISKHSNSNQISSATTQCFSTSFAKESEPPALSDEFEKCFPSYGENNAQCSPEKAFRKNNKKNAFSFSEQINQPLFHSHDTSLTETGCKVQKTLKLLTKDELNLFASGGKKDMSCQTDVSLPVTPTIRNSPLSFICIVDHDSMNEDELESDGSTNNLVKEYAEKLKKLGNNSCHNRIFQSKMKTNLVNLVEDVENDAVPFEENDHVVPNDGENMYKRRSKVRVGLSRRQRAKPLHPYLRY